MATALALFLTVCVVSALVLLFCRWWFEYLKEGAVADWRYWKARRQTFPDFSPPKVVWVYDLDLLALRDDYRLRRKRVPPLPSYWHLNGISWWEAPAPPKSHRCAPQTFGYLSDLTYVERCSCGAINMGPGARTHPIWLNRNEKKVRSETG